MPTTQTDPLLGVTYQYDDQGNFLGYTGGDGQYYAAGGSAPQQSSGGSLDSMIQSAAAEFGVDPNVLANMVDIESGGDPNAYRGSDGYGGGPSVGLMQVKPDIWGGLAQQIGADPYDPMGNLRLGAAILAQGVQQYGSYDAAIRNVYFPANDANGTTQDEYVARALGGSAPSFGGGASSSGSGGSSGQSNLRAMQAWQQDWVNSHTQGGGGGGYQKDASVPGGASAGGWGARSAPPVSGSGGGGSSGGSSGGGGGGDTRSLISAWRTKLMGGLYPGSGGSSSYGGSSGYSSYSPTTKPTPWWQYKIPGNPHGRSQGMDETTLAQTIYSNPEYMIPDALPNLNLNGPELASLSALPMTQFAMTLTKGKSNVSQYANEVSRLYDKIANTPYFPKFGDLARDLTHLPANSPLQDQFDPTAFIPYSPGSSYGSYNDPSQAASNYLGYLSQIANATLYGPVAQGATGYAQTLATKWGNRALHANPKNIQSINKYVGRRLFK